MSKLDFDKNGHLIPYDLISLKTHEIKEWFVDKFSATVTRPKIFNGYQNYCKDLYVVISEPFQQWVDGSFTTLKENPNDIDVVNLIHADKLNAKQNQVAPFTTELGNPKMQFQVDGYLMPFCDPTDRRHSYLERHRIYWRKQFGLSRNGEPKGIVHTEVAFR